MEVEDNKIVLPVLGVLLVAILGGAIWAAITIITDYQIGILALVIGASAGYVVVYLTKGKTSTVHQIIAVIGSLLGIVLGKYFTLAYALYENLEHIFDNETFTIFRDNFKEFFGLIDIIFVLLAFITAWRMTQRKPIPVIEPVHDPRF